jgi:hypothetical protein
MEIWGTTMKFPEWSYCKHISIYNTDYKGENIYRGSYHFEVNATEYKQFDSLGIYELWLWSFRNAFIVLYPYSYSLLRGATYQMVPFSTYALNLTMLPLLETFFRNCCCGTAFSNVIIFLDVFDIPKFSYLKGRLYFWKQPQIIRS